MRRSSAQSASPPRASMPTTTFCVEWQAITSEPTRQSTRRCGCAIELDPDFASAYGVAAWCYGWCKINGWVTDRAREIAETARLARRFVDLSPDDAVALSRGAHALGYVVGHL